MSDVTPQDQERARDAHVYSCPHERHNFDATHMKRFPPSECDYCRGWDAAYATARKVCECAVCEAVLRGQTRQACTNAENIATALAEQRGQLREYLDSAITKWRAVRDTIGEEHQTVAPCYIDALQSVRASILGETLPAEAKADQSGERAERAPAEPAEEETSA